MIFFMLLLVNCVSCWPVIEDNENGWLKKWINGSSSQSIIVNTMNEHKRKPIAISVTEQSESAKSNRRTKILRSIMRTIFLYGR